MNKAIFLDRDGVINDDRGYIYKIEHYKFISGVFEALQLLQKHNYKIFIVTNQGGIGKNYYSQDDYQILTNWIKQQLKKNNLEITQIYHCPHHPEAVIERYKVVCDCRKPKPGMLLQAAKEHNILLSSSFMIGDCTTDIQAGKSAGCKTILVKTGYGGSDKICLIKPDYISENLLQAARLVLEKWP